MSRTGKTQTSAITVAMLRGVRDVEAIIGESLQLSSQMLTDNEFCGQVRRAGDAFLQTYRSGGRVYACGNGGSAAHAQHFTAELTGRFLLERAPLPAEALQTNASHVTAVANDYHFEEVFSRALLASVKPVDSLVILTASGRSRNIIRAAEAANSAGAAVIAMTGINSLELAPFADVVLAIPSADCARVQEKHLILLHALAERVEHEMFG